MNSIAVVFVALVLVVNRSAGSWKRSQTTSDIETSKGLPNWENGGNRVRSIDDINGIDEGGRLFLRLEEELESVSRDIDKKFLVRECGGREILTEDEVAGSNLENSDV
ncbi:hypothetical protein TorRG33x02_038040 [Trema orientale]|uniref:Transmembrane protein n=1 Tax=Trema orientale TaxID=63057 RepID=A0A2P5FRJ5_TREOI|nr:hypothetical protein TorRG33x02_038040 [Trema orientale]